MGSRRGICVVALGAAAFGCSAIVTFDRSRIANGGEDGGGPVIAADGGEASEVAVPSVPPETAPDAAVDAGARVVYAEGFELESDPPSGGDDAGAPCAGWLGIDATVSLAADVAHTGKRSCMVCPLPSCFEGACTRHEGSASRAAVDLSAELPRYPETFSFDAWVLPLRYSVTVSPRLDDPYFDDAGGNPPGWGARTSTVAADVDALGWNHLRGLVNSISGSGRAKLLWIGVSGTGPQDASCFYVDDMSLSVVPNRPDGIGSGCGPPDGTVTINCPPGLVCQQDSPMPFGILGNYCTVPCSAGGGSACTTAGVPFSGDCGGGLAPACLLSRLP